MKDKNSLHTSPQLDRHEQLALALSPKQIHSLFNKAVTSGFSTDVIVEVYTRGYDATSANQVQAGFDRVNSFINGGEAATLDSDLTEGIKHVAKQATKDVLSTAFPHVAKAVSRYKKKSKWRKAMMKESVVNEPQSTDPDEPSARFVGTDSLTKILKAETPGQQRVETIKRVIKDAQSKEVKESLYNDPKKDKIVKSGSHKGISYEVHHNPDYAGDHKYGHNHAQMSFKTAKEAETHAKQRIEHAKKNKWQGYE